MAGKYVVTNTIQDRLDSIKRILGYIEERNQPVQTKDSCIYVARLHKQARTEIEQLEQALEESKQ